MHPTRIRSTGLLRLAPIAFAMACCVTAISGRAETLFDLGERYFTGFDDLGAIGADIVMDIRQDSSGFLWLATQKGLVRYDGYEFRVFRHDDGNPESIAGDYVQAIHFADRKNAFGAFAAGFKIKGLSKASPLRPAMDSRDFSEEGVVVGDGLWRCTV